LDFNILMILNYESELKSLNIISKFHFFFALEEKPIKPYHSF